MLDIPQRLAGLVSDYKMNLVEARKNDLSLHNTNNIDLFQLLGIIMNRNLSRQEAREQAISYADSHKVDKSVIMTVAGATNSRIDYNAFEKGDGKMCTLFEEIAKENESRGRQEGRQEGEARQIVEMGQEFGLSESDILLRLQKKLNVSEETAQAFLQMFGK